MLQQILWTACVTPFIIDGSAVDYNNLENLLRLQAEAGNGVVLLGSTGEALSLTDQERKKIVEFACQLNLPLPILVGVPSHNLYAALDWLDFCRSLPLAGYLMTTPIYTKPGIIGQTKWFETLLNKAAHPAMLYNIPSRAAVRLYTEVIANLKDHPNLKAIKDCSGTPDSALEYKLAAPAVAVYCGDDYMMPATAAVGATGLVSIAANVWPKQTRQYVQRCLQGDYADAKIWWQTGKALFSASNPIPVKALMKDVQLLNSDAVRLPLSLEDLPTRRPLVDFNALIAGSLRMI